MRVDGDQAGRHVRDHHRDSEGADALRPALHQRRVALFDLLEAADARAHDDADVVGIHLSGIQSRLRKRLLGRGQSELAVAADVAGRLAVHVVLGVEALDLGRDLGVEPGGVEPGDRADA